MGRPRTPTSQLKLRGSYNVTTHGERSDELFPTLTPDTEIEAPAHLSDRAKVMWSMYINRLLPIGAIADIDLPVLEMACSLYDELECIEKDLAKVRSKKSKSEKDRLYWYKYNAQYIKTMHELTQILCRFGATPAERTKIASLVKRPEKKDDDSILAFLDGDEE